MSNNQNDNLCECQKKLGRDLGQFCFWFARQDDYGGPLPMRQDLLPAWVFLEFCTFSQRVITTLHALRYLQAHWGTLIHQIWPSYECSTPWQYTWLTVHPMHSNGWTDTLGWLSYWWAWEYNIHKIQITIKYMVFTFLPQGGSCRAANFCELLVTMSAGV